MSKVALVLVGLALVLAIAAVVASRVKLGSFLPGIGLVAAIGVIAAFFAIRSHQSVARKAMVVTAVVLVVAAAIPASLKVVYPVYNRFFPQKSTQASHPATADSGSGPGAPLTRLGARGTLKRAGRRGVGARGAGGIAGRGEIGNLGDEFVSSQVRFHRSQLREVLRGRYVPPPEYWTNARLDVSVLDAS